MGTLREIRKRETRQRLYETAVRLFRERGYDDVSVDEIVTLAGTAKGTFFNYFPTKDHVLAEYHDRMTASILSRVEGREFGSCEAAIGAFVQACADVVEEDRTLMAIVVREIFSSRLMFGADQRNSRRSVEWWDRHVERGVAGGELDPGLDRETFLSMIAAVMSSTFIGWAMGLDFDLRDTLRRRTAFVFDAARARSAT